MAGFKGLVLTTAGEALFAKCLAKGKPLQIVRLSAGDGELPPGFDQYGLTAMISEKYNGTNVTKIVTGSQIIQLENIMDSGLITEGFYLREIGIIALDPDGGEVLYAYENVGEFADFVPVNHTATYMRRTIRVLIKVADASNVEVSTSIGSIEVRVKVGEVTVDTLPAGSPSAVDIIPDGDTLHFNFKLTQGSQGEQGKAGERGEQGLGMAVLGSFPNAAALISAYPNGSALNGGFLITGFSPSHYFYWDILNNLWADAGAIQGVKGDKGDKGADGTNGINGTNGKDGAPGTNGIDGKDGAPGTNGIDGKDGATGPQGPIGQVNIIIKTVALPASGWAGTDYFTQTVSVPDVTESMPRPIADVDLSNDPETARIQRDNWFLVDKIKVNNGSVTAFCLDKMPETDLTFTLRWI